MEVPVTGGTSMTKRKPPVAAEAQRTSETETREAAQCCGHRQTPVACRGSQNGRPSSYIYIYIHVEYIRYIRDICSHMSTYIHTYLPTYIHTYMHAYIHTYIHTCIYIYTYDICLHMSIYIICSSGSILAPLGPAWHQTFFTSFYRHIFRFISPLKKILGLADHSGDCCPWWPRWSSNFYDSQAAKCGIVAKIWSFMDHVMYIYKDLHIAGSFCSARSFEWHFWFLSGELFVGSSATWTS